jgi:hypothetical protein
MSVSSVKKETWMCDYCKKQYDYKTHAVSCACKFAKIARTTARTKLVEKSTPTRGACFRCGRSGHWANTCYAKSTVNGDYLDSDSE